MTITHPQARNLLVSSPMGLTDYRYKRFELGDTDILIHELNHVRQYRELGRYNFTVQYLIADFTLPVAPPTCTPDPNQNIADFSAAPDRVDWVDVEPNPPPETPRQRGALGGRPRRAPDGRLLS
jgi:hypothetical protein